MKHQLVATFLAAAIAVPAICIGQVSIDPANPKPFHLIRVKVAPGGLGPDADGQTDTFNPGETQVTLAGNKITISPLMRGHVDFGGLPPVPFDQMIGAFPPGTYQVEIIRRATGRGSAGPVGGTVTFTVPAATTAEPLVNYTDLWWRAEESGWGLGLFHHPSNQIFGTLFVYGADGRPTWYVMPNGQFIEPHIFQGPLFRTTGPYYGGPFNPTQVLPVAAGTATIEFDRYDLDKALIAFTIDGVTFNKFVRRQSF